MEKPSLDKAKAGAFRFNTDSSQLEIYDGNQWAGIVATSAQQQTGATRGFWAGGEAPSKTNVIQFVNIETTGDTVDFGDASYTLSGHTAFSSRTRGLIMGGALGPQPTNYANTIEFVTMSSTGNTVDFGDSITNTAQRASLASSTRGVMIGGLLGGAILSSCRKKSTQTPRIEILILSSKYINIKITRVSGILRNCLYADSFKVPNRFLLRVVACSLLIERNASGITNLRMAMCPSGVG